MVPGSYIPEAGLNNTCPPMFGANSALPRRLPDSAMCADHLHSVIATAYSPSSLLTLEASFIFV
jgi:hypothetical protein